MRIHTNRLTADDIYGILHACKKKGLIGSAVTLDIMREHGSRSHVRAFEVSMGAPAGTPSHLADDAREQITGLLEAYGAPEREVERACKRAAMRRSRSAFGTTPADYPMTATWHEWGYLLGAMFNADPELKTGPYEDIEAFDYQTRGERVPGWAIAEPVGLAAQGRMTDFLTATA